MLDKNIIGFLASAITFGFIASYLAKPVLKLGDEGTLTLFAFFIVLLAAVFPRVIAPLQREQVDFWYYSLAIIAVLALFFHSEAQRRKLDVASEYQKLHTERAELEGKLAVIRQTTENPNEILAHVQSRSREIAGSLISMKTSICACAISPEQCDARIAGRPSTMDPEVRLARSTHYALQCKALEEGKAEEVWIRLSKLQRVGELSNFSANELKGRGETVTIGGVRLLISNVVSDLVLSLSNPAGLDERRADVVGKVAQKTQALQDLRMRYEEPERIGDASHPVSSVFILNLWPYVLISLLGLKIARVKYF